VTVAVTVVTGTVMTVVVVTVPVVIINGFGLTFMEFFSTGWCGKKICLQKRIVHFFIASPVLSNAVLVAGSKSPKTEQNLANRFFVRIENFGFCSRFLSRKNLCNRDRLMQPKL
jgi:hypothetical protein